MSKPDLVIQPIYLSPGFMLVTSRSRSGDAFLTLYYKSKGRALNFLHERDGRLWCRHEETDRVHLIEVARIAGLVVEEWSVEVVREGVDDDDD